MFSYIDLFAGCGGLSLGLRRGGGTELLAVEKSEGAARTFHSNLISQSRDSKKQFAEHLSLSIPEQASAGLIVAPVAEVLEVFEKLGIAPGIDLVAGGPPCQGFSLAGKRDKDDVRNRLVWEFLEFVKLSNPKFVIIENVVGMGRKFLVEDEHSTFSDVELALSTTGLHYVVNAVLVNALHYGAPQRRPRLMLIGVRKDVADVLGIEKSDNIWKSGWNDEKTVIPDWAPTPVPARLAVTLADALEDFRASGGTTGQGAYLSLLADYASWGLTAKEGGPHNHEIRRHRPDTIYRFRFAQAMVKMGINVRSLGPIAKEALQKELDKVDRWFAAVSGRSVIVGAAQFSDADVFKTEILRLRNKKHSQRVLQWTQPAYTVVTIPDDYIHPDEPRTFTVRELARFQGFPDDFVFEGKATTGGTDRRTSVPQYTQVGNAVSPLVGMALGALVDDLATRYQQLSQRLTRASESPPMQSKVQFAEVS